MRPFLALVVLLAAFSLEAAPPPERLKEAFAGRFAIGVALPSGNLTAPETALLARHFDTVTPEACMKPRCTQPVEGRFDFAAGDALVALAAARGITVNGHTLVWHHHCPDWFFRDGDKPAGKELALRRMRAHIAAVAGHFAGKLASWDVVNEALGKGPDYLRRSDWLEAAGEDFIHEAFIAARQADPRAELYYNDFGIEEPEKRGKALRLVRDIRRRGARLDGIGIQGHYQLDQIPYQDLEDAIVAFHAEGLKVMITELDLDVVPRPFAGADAGEQERAADDPYPQDLPPELQRRQAEQYAKLFALFLKHADKVSRVTFWGLHDGRSWLNGWPRKRTNHPLLWNRDLQPKPALAAVLGLARP